MNIPGNQIIEIDHKAMVTRLRKVAAEARRYSQVSVDEADLRQLLAFAEECLWPNPKPPSDTP